MKVQTNEVINQNPNQYLEFGPTVDRDNRIDAIAKELDPTASVETIATHLAELFDIIYWSRSEGPRSATSLRESRHTPATAALASLLWSCGAVCSVAAAILRARGLPTRLVHVGSADTSHAYLEIFDQSDQTWHAFDFVGSDTSIAVAEAKEVPKIYCADWSELDEILGK